MPIMFTDDDPPFVDTVDENEGSFLDSGDDLSEAGTESSVSAYEGDITDAPLKMFFGPKECRRIFEQASDQNAFVRVCGRKEDACKRGHAVLQQAREGYYDTVASRKYVDGRLHTFQSKQERRDELKNMKASRDEQLASSVKFLASLEDPKSKEDETPALFPLSSLKKAPAYSEPPDEKINLPSTPSTSNPPEGLGSVVFMVGALTDTLKDLKEEMRSLKGQVGAVDAARTLQTPRPVDPSLPPESGTRTTTNVPPPVIPESKPVLVEPSDWWYAVVKGKNGASGVFPSWDEASDLVLGVSGALVEKYHDYDEAVTFVLSCRAPSKPKEDIPTHKVPKALDPSWFAVAKGKHGVSNIFKSWEEASEFFLGIPGATVQKFKTRGEALTFLESSQHQNPPPSETPPAEAPTAVDAKDYRPPMILTGPDPSAKKSDEVFGLDLGSELDLRAALLPPNLPDGVSRGLANAMVDVIAIPGGFAGGVGTDESEGNEMALLGEAVEELVSQGRNQAEGASKADLHWRSGKRTSLRQVKNLDSLRKRIKVLLKLRDKVIKHTIIAVRNACKRGGWQDEERIEAWAHGGFITRITRDSMDYYLSLHQHLMGLLIAGAPWDYVKMEQDHHVEELDLIRTTQDSRIQALCCLYAYLRDGQNKNWHSDELQYKRNMDIFGRNNEGGISGDDLSTLGSSSNHCLKCGTSIHTGGKANCPWNTMSDTQARKNANKYIRQIANPTTAATPTVPP